MVEIASANQELGILQKTIAENQNLSEKYLDQIISSLKSSGLIRNLRSKKSGYILTKPSIEITMYDIIKAFNPTPDILDCLADGNSCESDRSCASQQMWRGLNQVMKEYLQAFTLEKLAKDQMAINQRLVGSPMYYI